MGFTIQQKTYEVVPTGDYPAEIDQIDLEQGQSCPQLTFPFRLPIREDGKPMCGWASASFTPKSKLYAWTRAAMGGQMIPPSYNLNTDHLIGKRVLLTVVISRKDDGAEYNKIQDVRPYLNGNAQPVAAATAPIYLDGNSF